ncbi:LacI family DNA-binding transcriptional regulator [Desulfovibrio cuneatus]|uniref:LacI family DNA-binding transcriptional regulator n=1 Tax=Desulfovibrio cuneatus TaxID=159728 RepID=UPI000415A9EF|nr:LacI family DNA-binding transcriptional regulator [Desulfovibrio cuneatus]
MTKVTIYELAAKVGLSAATISRAIHAPHKLSQRTLDRIHCAMEECNYSYNAAAANFSKGSSTTISTLVPFLQSSVFSSTVVGIQEYAYKNMFNVVVSSTGYDPHKELELLRQTREQRCAGVLLTGYCAENERAVLELAKTLPVVVMWEISQVPLHCVGFDNYTVTCSAVECLVSLGHKRIAAIAGPFSVMHRARQRLEAYLDTLQKHGLEISASLYSERCPSIQDGNEAMHQLLALPQRPSAVLCNNDLQAVGAISAIKKAGLRVPEDISIFGFDDIELAPYLSPSLSTVHVPGYEIGKLSTELLFRCIHAQQHGIVQHIVETPLVFRDSCCQYNA